MILGYTKGDNVIVVEGPDGSGKTTLVKRIMESKLGSELELMPRAVSKEAKSLTKIDDYIEEELGKGFGMRLYDRFALISSPCYAMLPDRTFTGRMFDPVWLRAHFDKMYQVDPVIIMCLPSLDTVVGNTRIGDDNRVVQEDIEAIYINYLSYWAAQGSTNGTSMMRWDYHNPDQQRLDNLLQWAKGRVDYAANSVEGRIKKWKTDFS